MSKTTMFARPAFEEAEDRDVRTPAEISARMEENASYKEAGCITCAGLTGTSISGLFDTRFGIDGTFEVRRCVRCGMEQLSPIPAVAELKNLYEHYYHFCGERGTIYTSLREWFFSSFLYRMWIRLDGDISFHSSTGSGRLLYIGCNEGRTLKNYARNGFRAEATELNETAAAAAPPPAL